MASRANPARRGTERRGWYRRGFAWAMHATSAGYETMVSERKRALFAGLSGVVAEIGPGTGPNFASLPPVERWIGIEPNVHMHPYLKRAAKERGIAAEIRPGLAESLPLDDASVDAVIGTLVLCSVDDLGAALAEVRRVLRPGGRYVFVEHVAAEPGTRLRTVQRLVSPLHRRISDGCRPDRETARAIEAAGFAKVELERVRVPIGLAAPHVFGMAIR